jgi:dTDP-4-dehydrorhamnose reductase
MTQTRKVLVVGGTGMLGHKLAHVLGADPALEVHATVRRPPPAAFAAPGVRYHEGVDLGAGSRAVAPLMEALAPDVVVNAVGAIKQKDLYAAMDETFFLNASLPHLLALLNPNPAGRVVHFSTDCVFTGERGGYRDSDAPDALDLYGRSKACGEIGYGRHLTLRTSIIGFEPAGQLGLLSWFLNQPPGSELRGFTGAIYSGLPTVTLSRTVRSLIHDHPELTGVYQVASEPISKFDLLVRLGRALGVDHRLVPVDEPRIDRSLDDERFRRDTGTRRPDWDTLVAELAEDFGSLPYREHYRTFAAV